MSITHATQTTKPNNPIYPVSATAWNQTHTIAAGTILGSHISNATIIGDNIATATILGTHIGSATISGTNIGSATITGGNIGVGAIEAINLGSASVTADKIGSLAITSSKIDNVAVTTAKIALLAITSALINVAAITAEKIGDAAVTTAKLNDLAVTGAKIADATITAAKIGLLEITAANIANLTITAANIANLTITGGKVAENTISPSKLTFAVFDKDTDDLDDVDNGTTYSRVRTGSLDATGLVLLDVVVEGTYGLVRSTDISGGHILLSEVSGNLDDVSNGSTYGRVLLTDISAGHIKLSEVIGSLDDVDNGTTYGRVLVTDISAGHILLSSCSGNLDNVGDGSTYHKTTVNEVTGAGRAYSGINSSGNFLGAVDPINVAPSASGSGLYLGSDYLGYYSGSTWTAFINSSGQFKFSKDANSYVMWDGNIFEVKGSVTITGGSTTTQYISDYSDKRLLTDNQQTGAGRAYGDIDSNGNFVGAVAPGHVAPVSGAALYLGSNYLGYYNGSSWTVYIANNGTFLFQGDANNYVSWNGSSLAVKGSVTITGGSGIANLTDAGDMATKDNVATGDLQSGVTDRMFDSSSASDNIQGWPHASDVTKIDGGDIYTGSITALGVVTAGSFVCSTSGYVRGGQTAYNTGTGFWLGYDSTYKFSIGNPSGNYLLWDGSSLTVNANGVRIGIPAGNQINCTSGLYFGSDDTPYAEFGYSNASFGGITLRYGDFTISGAYRRLKYDSTTDGYLQLEYADRFDLVSNAYYDGTWHNINASSPSWMIQLAPDNDNIVFYRAPAGGVAWASKIIFDNGGGVSASSLTATNKIISTTAQSLVAPTNPLEFYSDSSYVDILSNANIGFRFATYYSDAWHSLFVVDASGNGVFAGNLAIAGASINSAYALNILSSSASQAIRTEITKTSGNNYGVLGQATGSGATLNIGLYGYATGATTNWGLYVDSSNAFIGGSVFLSTDQSLCWAGKKVLLKSGSEIWVGDLDAQGWNTFLRGSTIYFTINSGGSYVTPMWLTSTTLNLNSGVGLQVGDNLVVPKSKGLTETSNNMTILLTEHGGGNTPCVGIYQSSTPRFFFDNDGTGSADNTWTTFSPKIPKTYDETIRQLSEEYRKEQSPRNNEGNLKCHICGEPYPCGNVDHEQGFIKLYRKDIGKAALLAAKAIVEREDVIKDLLHKIDVLETENKKIKEKLGIV